MKVQIKPIYIVVSAMAHIGVVGALSLSFTGQVTSVYHPPSVRVDVVALPDKAVPRVLSPKRSKSAKPSLPPKKQQTKKQQANKQAHKQIKKPKPQKQAPQEPSLKNLKASQNKALSQLDQQLDKINTPPEKKTPKKTNAAQPDTNQPDAEKNTAEADETLVKGQRITSGDSLQGLERLRFDAYHARLQEHVKGVWVVPSWLVDPSLRAQVMIVINAQGGLSLTQLLSSSGNPTFDELVMQSVQKAVPLPVPPPQLDTRQLGFVLSFTGAEG